MSEISHRAFQATDADGVHTVAQRAWRYTYGPIYDSTYIDNFVAVNYAPEALAFLASRVQAGQIFFDVAELESDIIGFCQMSQSDVGMELLRLYVLPAFIGQGIGFNLLQRGETYLRERDAEFYGCFVHRNNVLGRRFYQRAGFQRVKQWDQDDEWYLEKRL